MEGYCYNCAKKKGINPTEALADQNHILSSDKVNLNDMTKQFETIFKDLAENINLEDIQNIEGAITFESDNDNPNESNKISGAAIPLGSIFSNLFNGNKASQNSEEELNNGRKKVKVEKRKNKKSSKKKKFLDNNSETKIKTNDVGTYRGILGVTKAVFQNRPKINLKDLKKEDYIAMSLTAIIMIVVLVVMWFIPFTNGFIKSMLPFLK